MQENYTEICGLLDRSGSMQEIKSDTEGGWNSFIDDQRTIPGKCLVSLAEFDDRFKWVYSGQDIAQVPPLELKPRNRTAFLDAMGRSIEEFGHRLSQIPEPDRPAKVIFTIMTDGLENASRAWTVDRVNALVRQQIEVYNWTFLYLGANMDAVQEAQKYGIPSDYALTYTGENVSVAMAATSRLVGGLRTGAPSASGGYTAEDREAALFAAAPVTELPDDARELTESQH